MQPDDADRPLNYGALAQSIGFQLRMAQLRMFDLFFERLAEKGLKPGEFTVLWVVSENPGSRQGSIARDLRIKPAHMTKLIQRLVSAGYVARTIPHEDRRSVCLSLTQDGADFIAAHRGAFLELHETERARLTPAEASTLLALLGKLNGTKAAP